MKTPNQEFTTAIGIDPGGCGGIAVYRTGEPVVAYAMPPTQADVLHLMRELTPEPARSLAFAESFGGFVGKAQPGSSAFKFGRGFGFLLGVLHERGVRVEMVLPRTWQKGFNLGRASASESKAHWKRKLRAEAQRRFPALKVTLSTADALLILDHGLRTMRATDDMKAFWIPASPPPEAAGSRCDRSVSIYRGPGLARSRSSGTQECPMPGAGKPWPDAVVITCRARFLLSCVSCSISSIQPRVS